MNSSNELISNYMPLANKLAWKYKKTAPYFVPFDEIQSAAYFGLVDAASRYQKEKGSFSNFAFIRIIGEIKDYFKNNISKIPQISTSLEDSSIDLEAKSTKTSMETEDFFEFATKVLNAIGKKVIRLYYIEGKSMKEIGEILNISESRVSQIMKEYLRQIKLCYLEKLAV